MTTSTVNNVTYCCIDDPGTYETTELTLSNSYITSTNRPTGLLANVSNKDFLTFISTEHTISSSIVYEGFHLFVGPVGMVAATVSDTTGSQLSYSASVTDSSIGTMNFAAGISRGDTLRRNALVNGACSFMVGTYWNMQVTDVIKYCGIPISPTMCNYRMWSLGIAYGTSDIIGNPLNANNRATVLDQCFGMVEVQSKSVSCTHNSVPCYNGNSVTKWSGSVTMNEYIPVIVKYDYSDYTSIHENVTGYKTSAFEWASSRVNTNNGTYTLFGGFL